MQKLNEGLITIINKHKLEKGDTFKFEKEDVSDDTNGYGKAVEIEGYKLMVRSKGNGYVKYPCCSDGGDYDTCDVEIEVLETPVVETKEQTYEQSLEKRIQTKINDLNEKIKELKKDSSEGHDLEQKAIHENNFSMVDTYRSMYKIRNKEITELEKIRDALNDILVGDDEFITG